MKVDMSPKAVKERLQTIGELWLLSVKLINSKKIKSAKEKEVYLPDSEKDSEFIKNETA